MKHKVQLIHDGESFRGLIETELSYEAYKRGQCSFPEGHKIKQFIIPATVFYRLVDLDKNLWISIKDKLPEKNQRVMCIFKESDGITTICENTYKGKGVWFSDGSTITHWMPLPDMPEDL